MVFFQTGGDRPLDVLFLPSADVPNSLRTGTTTLDEAQQVGPLQAISGLTAADNDAAPLQIQLAAGQVFEVSNDSLQPLEIYADRHRHREHRYLASCPTVLARRLA